MIKLSMSFLMHFMWFKLKIFLEELVMPVELFYASLSCHTLTNNVIISVGCWEFQAPVGFYHQRMKEESCTEVVDKKGSGKIFSVVWYGMIVGEQI